LRFGDVVTAVASLVVILVLVDFLLGIVLIPAIGLDWGGYVTGAVSIFLTAFIVGYVFARKIWEEAGMEAIAKITVLGAVLMVFYVVNFPALGDWTPAVKEAIQKAHPTSTFSTSQWVTLESMALTQTVAINMVMAIVFGFIGLYVGSMLRRPAKSQK